MSVPVFSAQRQPRNDYSQMHAPVSAVETVRMLFVFVLAYGMAEVGNLKRGKFITG